MLPLYKSIGLLFISIIFMVNTEGDIFTSIDEMVNLVETEAKIADHLEYFLNKQMEKINSARKIVEEFKQIKNSSISNPENFVANPVNSFLLIKKLSTDLQSFVDIINSYEQLKDLVNQIKEKFYLPTNADYRGAIMALHRLEDVYSLEPSDFRTGSLSTSFPSRNLNALECFEIGKAAYEEQDYYHTVKWMTEALKLHELEGANPTANIVDILDYLSFSTAHQGNAFHALDLTKKILLHDPSHKRASSNLEYYEKYIKDLQRKSHGDLGSASSVVIDPFEIKNPRPPSVLGYERDIYESLCRSEEFVFNDPKITKLLKCRYLNDKPMLYIAPVKEEQVFYDPAIWIYHDVITESQIQLMKRLATPKLKRAIVRSPITGQFETADYRISKSAWLNDNEVPRLAYLTNLVNSVTNLSMETAEEWQIANYGIGGQYDPHFDFARKTEPGNAFDKSIGNRVATWLFYLEVPEQGGATVFPRIGARIQPKRKSAAFWYNLYASGEGDYRTRHAACPVLIGQKWVSNKWIHLGGQEFIRPCHLAKDPSEED